jgi:virginiamycin B lyase
LPLPYAVPSSITAGPDGNLWVTESAIDKIARVTPAGEVREFELDTGDNPVQITVGPDANLWFVAPYRGIERITPTGRRTIVFTADSSTDLSGVAAGPDGNIWFGEIPFPGNQYGSLVVITPAGLLVKRIGTFGIPQDIVAGPDGNMWFTEFVCGSHDCYHLIGRVAPSGDDLMEYPADALGPLTAGPDGNVWFAEGCATGSSPPFDCVGPARIARVTPEFVVTEFSLPRLGTRANGITTGLDGRVWFTDRCARKYDGCSGPDAVGWVDPSSGIVSEFTPPSSNGGVGRIAPAPDGGVWFTEFRVGRLGRAEVAAEGTSYVLARTGSFAPRARAVSLGTSVAWMFLGPGIGSVEDTTGLGLLDSGPHGFVSWFSHRFDAAGSYPYVNGLSSSLSGVVRVPVQVAPSDGTETTQFTITWGVAPPPRSLLFDVQVKRPGELAYADWQRGVFAAEASFTPDAGPGVYWFRARLHGPAGTLPWSPPTSIQVTI